ncbi:hypothetical protein V9T40_009455 [Parthenolecanium corni]|uniref:branched-chain-amino-acid transaminase n=1 Tax=Parthenolecanium corni TaxID=536013 RepID=A0AAN9Y866_9HEMI
MPETIDKSNQQAPKFGSVFTDHMLRMEYDGERGGWQQPEITKMENISLHPAARVLHYATTLFEGMKAFRGVDGKIRLFRPLLNLQRLNQSAERACLPKVNKHDLLRHIEKLIRLDENFIPFTKEGSLYIRPTLIGTDAQIGVGVPNRALLFVILSPTASYFDSGSKPLRLMADPNYVRAWIGGAGDRKIGSNYGPTIYVQAKAQMYGCQQALWLYGEDEQITEAGTMAIFAHFINDKGERELRTAPLNGLILPSITRRSILELSREWNEFNVVEDKFTMSDLIRLRQENRLLELFGAGTACLISPVSEIFYRNRIIRLPTKDHPNPLYSRFYKSLNDIYYGRVNHPWGYEVGVADYSIDFDVEAASIL